MRIENKLLTELFLSHEREQLETATKRVKTDTERYTYTPKTRADRRKIRQKGMSTENNIGVQTRAMAQRVDNEENPEQVQKGNGPGHNSYSRTT